MEWIIIWIALIVILVAIAVLVLFLMLYKRPQIRRTQWYVEMWNICYGYVLQMQFDSNMVLGRNTAYYLGKGNIPAKPDATVSAEHCMLYEQNGELLICNMSAVNPAVVNGHRLNMPVRLEPGDRLEMGKTVFLVTRVVTVDV